ncbi:hypothetical protein HG530_003867 [Fusarium avenaceum]|nr:hypothetical protein HG530_003867 [Fusarium avenaceum]
MRDRASQRGGVATSVVVTTGSPVEAGTTEFLRDVIAGQVSGRLGLEAEAAGAVLRLSEVLVDGLIKGDLCIITEVAEADGHRLGSGLVGAAGASAAPGEAISRSRRSALEVVLAVHGQMLLSEVDLEVRVGIVVPVLCSVNGVANTEEEGLGLEVGCISELDGKGKAVMSKWGFPWADFVAVVSGNLRGGLPVVQGETARNGLVESEVGDSHRTQKGLLVGGEPQLF